MLSPRQLIPLVALLGLGTALDPMEALLVPDDPSPLAQKAFRHPDLQITPVVQQVAELPAPAAAKALEALATLGVVPERARIDRRSGRFATLMPHHPLLPGSGKGNGLSWETAGGRPPADRAAIEHAAWRAFTTYLREHLQDLRVDPAELAIPGRLAVHEGGDLVQIHLPRVVGGIPVRDSFVSAVIRHGNLILFGAHQWGDVDLSTEPRLTVEEAAARVRSFVAPHPVAGFGGKAELIVVPLVRGQGSQQGPVGQGYSHRLSWRLSPRFDGDLGNWEALVDAHDGELLAFDDLNHYAEVRGGVLPVSNDGVPPDGVEQRGWPMPFDRVSTASGIVIADSGGNFTPSGTNTSTLSGQFIRMSDNCGAISLSSTGDIDFGTSDGTDCVTPGFGGAGNTHASRNAFYELNRIKEMARGQLPGNTWLQQQLTANVNINGTCNAFWNGSTVNFYRSGAGCSNTGELAGLFDHEWGHGMDANDATPGVSSPGEGIADIYTALRLNNSCIGRNFRPGIPCGGYGDPCIDCTGVRDIDFTKRASGQPHDVSWALATCGTSVHCRGYVYSESVWDLWKRDLPVLFGMDDPTAHEAVTRLTFLGAGGVGTWFANTPPFGGCSASGGYLNFLAADDDNGDLGDGTPHMTAIFAAFNRHEIACDTPAVQDSGCAGTPAVPPVVTAQSLNHSANLTWSAVTGASGYQIFRSDGVSACGLGKVKVAETAGTSFLDSGLQNGREYSYVVVPIGPADTCLGPASGCTTVTPTTGPDLTIDPDSMTLTLAGGDGDPFLDNCETGTLSFAVTNTGVGSLTHVRIEEVTMVSHPSSVLETPLPIAVSPSSLAEGATGVVSLDFTGHGLAFDDTLVLRVGVTSDELFPVVKTHDFAIPGAEKDLQPFASKTFSFETDTEGWKVVQGFFTRAAGGGAENTAWSEVSSSFLDNQCDHIQSPILVLSGTSTLTLWSEFDIETATPGGVWYDRANVGIYDVATGSRTPVTPDGGRLYNAGGANGTCGTAGQNGWAGAATSWKASTWSASALGAAGLAGREVRLDVRYGTDASLNGFGFHFDQVTVTDGELLVPDTQTEKCCTTDADCEDGLYCNGLRTCDENNICQPGAPPCNDSVSCTIDTCDEASDTCTHTPDCDDGRFCNGTETCDAVLGCQAGTPIDCDDGVSCTFDICSEVLDECQHALNHIQCDDGIFCNGEELCDPILDCQPGVPPCDDGVDCTVDACDETSNICTNTPNDSFCRDSVFCDGEEVCNPAVGCEAGVAPCQPGLCDEASDVCRCQTDADCDDGLACNGLEACSDGVCQGARCAAKDGFEVGAGGWVASGDCLTGSFVVGTPDPVVNAGVITQPAGAASGSGAFFTAPNTGGAGVDDVDGGECVATSPLYTLTADSDISIWTYHGQRDAGDDPAGDYFVLEISVNGGAWTTLLSHGDMTVNAAWAQTTTTASVGDTVQLRVRVSDGPAAGDLIEAGIDDLTLCPRACL